ncbi:hypothetical protein KDL45_14090, partial [bacterium]|nr:hypothetical protein [bacterium]
EIGSLTTLKGLYLTGNQLTQLPPEIGSLTALEGLNLDGNQLRQLPSEIGSLTTLKGLYLRGNQLTQLPPEIGSLTELERLYFSGNPLTSPPADIIQQGTGAILQYLRGLLEQGESLQWTSKMLVVGEGGVGKTNLIRRLRNQGFKGNLDPTHGMMVNDVLIDHPEKAGLRMTLRAWDFGGQDIYHATHQFFLSQRSLYVLVWNARLGYEQGRLRYWLDMIQAAAPDAPVIVVATFCDMDKIKPDLPTQELKEAYPQIQNFLNYSTMTNEGIEDLRDEIAKHAAGLPLMGRPLPTNWAKASDDIRRLSETTQLISPKEFKQQLLDCGVEEDSLLTVATDMHDLGEVLYYLPESRHAETSAHDDPIDDYVILDSEWVSQEIAKILDSKDVTKKHGLLSKKEMEKLWAEHDAHLRDFLLRLMETYDLSYRTTDRDEVCLVVELLPHDPKEDYDKEWNAIHEKPNCKEISVRYQLNTMQPGIPTWAIARAHDHSMGNHWRSGAVLADNPKDPRNLAMLRSNAHDRYVDITVRGEFPFEFMGRMKYILESTLKRYPGLSIECKVPHRGDDMHGRPFVEYYDLDLLADLVSSEPPVYAIMCLPSRKNISVPQLLMGLHHMGDACIAEELKTIKANQEEMLTMHRQFASLQQRHFLLTYNALQNHRDTRCPNTFVFRPVEKIEWSRWKQDFVEEKTGQIAMQLYCQEPGHWHPLGMPQDPTKSAPEIGYYVLNQPGPLLKAMGPYIQKAMPAFKVLAKLAPTAFAAYNVATGNIDPALYERMKADIDFMSKLIEVIPELDFSRRSDLDRMASYDLDLLERETDPERLRGAQMRFLQRLLKKLDPGET